MNSGQSVSSLPYLRAILHFLLLFPYILLHFSGKYCTTDFLNFIKTYDKPIKYDALLYSKIPNSKNMKLAHFNQLQH